MAVRRPLKVQGTDLKEMTSAEVEAIQKEVVRLYGNTVSPAVSLSVNAGGGGNLTAMTDTRIIAGDGIIRADRFATEGELTNVSQVSTTYDRLDQTVNSTTFTTQALWGFPYNQTSYPLYYDSGNLKEMTEADFFDTFIYPAANLLVNNTDTNGAGTYTISTSTSVAGATLVSSDPVFTDTAADVASYTAGGLIETKDQPLTVNSYYLHRINAAAQAPFELPLCYTTSGTNLRQTPTATLQWLLEMGINHATTSDIGYRIAYNINGAGTNRGTTMINTAVPFTSTYLTNQVGLDDYRAQEVPSGTTSTVTGYNFRIIQY